MVLPPQKLSWADKTNRDPTSGKNNLEETIDYYINECRWTSHTEEILKLYAAVEGVIDLDEYRYIQNPFNHKTPKGENPTFAAQLRNYNILKSIVNLLLGEFGRRSHEYTVTSFSETQEIAYKDALAIVVKDYYRQLVTNKMNEIGIPTGVESQELPEIEQYVADFKADYDANLINTGQDAIDYCRYNCDLDSKFVDMYYDWVVTGGVVSYKCVNHDDVYYEHVPRHELYIPYEKHSRYAEDASFAVRRQIIPIAKVLDFFKGRVPDDFVTALDEHAVKALGFDYVNLELTGRNGLIRFPSTYRDFFSGTSFSSFQGVEVYHVQYKSFRKYGILTYEDELGLIQEIEVSDDYKLDKKIGDISIEWQYENQVIEGWKCLDFYLDVRPLIENRSDLNQNGLQKLSYNGILERSYTGEIQSIIKEGLPYQYLINTLHYNVEKLINKNKDKLLVMPFGLVPREKGMDTKTTMYHADNTSILWVDETAPNAQFAAQMIKSLDMGLGNYISTTIEIMKYIKSEYWEAIGMNAQRYSDIGERAGKAVTEQAIVRSAIITHELVRQFDKFLEKEYMGMVDISKLAWADGKKAKYIRSDGSVAILDINEDNLIVHTNASFGVFVQDSSLNTEGINAIRGQALAIIQNGGNFSAIGKLFSTNSVSKLTGILEKLEQHKQEYEQLVQQQQQEAAQTLQDSINENDNLNREVDIYKADRVFDAAIYTADARRDRDTSRDNVKEPTDLEREALAHKKEIDNRTLELRDKQLEIQKQKQNSNNKNK